MSREPNYHNAYIPQARAMLQQGYQCPCGCSATPDMLTLARDLWVQDLVGSVPRTVNLYIAPDEHLDLREPVEPTAAGRCRGCGREQQIAEYLAAFLKLRNAPWPECEDCKNKRGGF